MSCYCVSLAHREVERLKQEMFRAVDQYGYDHPIVQQISSEIDPHIARLTEVQLHFAQYARSLGGKSRDQRSRLYYTHA